MTNILLLPQLFGGYAADGVTRLPARFAVARNGDWLDAIPFPQPAPNSNSPLDITGIAFRGSLRAGPNAETDVIDFSTANGLMVNGGTTGVLSFNIATVLPDPLGGTSAFPVGTCLMDLLAIADGHTVNLFQQAGAAIVTVRQGYA